MFVKAVNYSLSVKDDMSPQGQGLASRSAQGQRLASGSAQGHGPLHLIELHESQRIASSQKNSPEGTGGHSPASYRSTPVPLVAIEIDVDDNNDDDGGEPLLSPFPGAKQTATTTTAAAATATATAGATTAVPSPWISVEDPVSGKTYYVNTLTG